jgi:ubiquinone/menaquinone biosynthesis C-methylase UbiE
MANQVKDFYDRHWQRFDVSRVRIWKCVRDFTSTLVKNSTVLDVGCGNGKNIKYLLDNDIRAFGIDFSEKLVKVCKRKKLDVTVGDVLNIPFNDNSFDNIISIAVIHHLQKEEDRIKALNEMIRVCKNNGKILISVWAVEQSGQEVQNRTFVYGDNLVKWENDERYYFIYDEEHIKKFVENFNVTNLVWERGNWYFEIIVNK